MDYERARRGGKIWWCSKCQTFNGCVSKRVFKIPTFHCVNCNQEYIQQHDLDFSLADVKVNRLPLVPKIFNQEGPECISNALCQMLQMLFTVTSAFENKRVTEDHPMLHLRPEWLYQSYYSWYPVHKYCRPRGVAQHKLLKILHFLRKEGIPRKDGKVYRVGDITFMDKADYKGICRELASGVPILVTFAPGRHFGRLQYGQFYTPPTMTPDTWDRLKKCNELHKQMPEHATHMVVLVGPATNRATGQKGYYAVNSWKEWCKRGHLPGFVEGHVPDGVGFIPESAIIGNVIKLWPTGVSAVGDPFRMMEECDSYNDPSIKAWNYCMLTCDLKLMDPPPPALTDPELLYCPFIDPHQPFCRGLPPPTIL